MGARRPTTRGRRGSSQRGRGRAGLIEVTSCLVSPSCPASICLRPTCLRGGRTRSLLEKGYACCLRAVAWMMCAICRSSGVEMQGGEKLQSGTDGGEATDEQTTT